MPGSHVAKTGSQPGRFQEDPPLLSAPPGAEAATTTPM
jgi:hypothetical protein